MPQTPKAVGRCPKPQGRRGYPYNPKTLRAARPQTPRQHFFSGAEKKGCAKKRHFGVLRRATDSAPRETVRRRYRIQAIRTADVSQKVSASNTLSRLPGLSFRLMLLSVHRKAVCALYTFVHNQCPTWNILQSGCEFVRLLSVGEGHRAPKHMGQAATFRQPIAKRLSALWRRDL